MSKLIWILVIIYWILTAYVLFRGELFVRRFKKKFYQITGRKI